jgi:hypothetical protein
MSKKKIKHPSDVELLQELATLDEVSAISVGSEDSTAGNVPQWSEILLTVKRFDDGSLTPAWPINSRLPLRRHDGELIIQVLWDVLHPNRTLSSTDAIWDDLDTCMEHIQKRVRKGKEPDPLWTGRAQGLAKAIAIVTNVLEPDVDGVKATAYLRYCIRHGISTDD